jgi:hypothetical protein
MNLEAVIVGAFYDEEVGKLLDLPGDEQPLYIIRGSEGLMTRHVSARGTAISQSSGKIFCLL